MDTNEFYRGKSLFITGATGFVGKVMLEKLLREFKHDLGTIFVLIRPKAEKRHHGDGDGKNRERANTDPRITSGTDRLRQEVFTCKVFDRCKAEIDDFEELFFSKIVAIEGELCKSESEESSSSSSEETDDLFDSLPPLIDRREDLERVVKECAIVIHCAASVSFESSIQEACTKNVTGALQVLKLAHSMERLEAYCHVSTAYVLSHRLGAVYEELPRMEMIDESAEQTYLDILGMDAADADRQTAALLGDYPNTYCFSKALCEHIIVSKRVRNVPLLIVRPTIIGAAHAEPFPGWTDSANAVGAVLLFAALGVLRYIYGKPWVNPDVVPVDLVANALLGTLAVAAGRHKRRLMAADRDGDVIAKDFIHGDANSPVHIVNSSCRQKDFTWIHLSLWTHEYFQRHPCARAIAPICSSVNPSYTLYRVMHFLQYKIPIRLFQVFIALFPTHERKKLLRRLIKVDTGIERNSAVFAHFTHNEWQFDATHLRSMINDLKKSDIERFDCDSSHVDMRHYVYYFDYGLHKYLLKDDTCTQDPGYLMQSHAHAELANKKMARMHRAVGRLQTMDTFLCLVPAVPVLLKSLFSRGSQTRVIFPFVWAVLGIAMYRLKKMWAARMAKDRVRRGQADNDRLKLYQLYETEYTGMIMNPIFLFLVEGVFNKPLFGSSTKKRGWLRRFAPAALMSLVEYVGTHVILSDINYSPDPYRDFKPQVTGLDGKSVTFDTSVRDGDEKKSSLFSSVLKWRKTLVLALLIAFFRTGKTMDERKLMKWLRGWERGRF